jgi:hypothetical protein
MTWLVAADAEGLLLVDSTMDPVAFHGHRGGRVLCVRLLGDNVAVSGGDAPTFQLLAWSVTTGKVVWRFPGASKAVHAPC